MTSTPLSLPLKYFSVGLSSCIHIILAILIFAQTYKHLTQQPLPPQELADSEDMEIEFDDYQDGQEASDASAETSIEFPEGSPHPEISEEVSTQNEEQSDQVVEQIIPSEAPEVVEPIAMPRKEVVTQRLKSKQSRWRKNAPPAPTEQPRKVTAARQLSNHFTNFMYQQQSEATERLSKAGGTPETLATIRNDYHKRVLNAVKAATNFFVKEYYASHDFTTPRIHVLFELDNSGNLTSIKLEPSSGYQDLDTALRNFVRSARFPKKPELLTILADEPYDFYILPLPVHKGENILKLVAQF
jgi:TonB family protein